MTLVLCFQIVTNCVYAPWGRITNRQKLLTFYCLWPFMRWPFGIPFDQAWECQNFWRFVICPLGKEGVMYWRNQCLHADKKILFDLNWWSVRRGQHITIMVTQSAGKKTDQSRVYGLLKRENVVDTINHIPPFIFKDTRVISNPYTLDRDPCSWEAY